MKGFGKAFGIMLQKGNTTIKQGLRRLVVDNTTAARKQRSQSEQLYASLKESALNETGDVSQSTVRFGESRDGSLCNLCKVAQTEEWLWNHSATLNLSKYDPVMRVCQQRDSYQAHSSADKVIQIHCISVLSK